MNWNNCFFCTQLFLPFADTKGGMGKDRTYYDILRVSPDAEKEVIDAAYRTLMSKLKKHPDLGGDTSEAVEINRAYETLSNVEERRAYDALLNHAPITKKRVANSAEIERRRVPRYFLNAIVSFCVGHDQRWYPARVKDMSTLGLRIQSHAEIVTGQHLVIAPANTVSPAIHGTVRWSRKFHPSVFERVYEAGIEFSDQITDIEQRLNNEASVRF